jgi:hypothetical protein
MTLCQNIRKVAFSHKRLEVSILENFMDDEENELNLMASFNNYKERVERLELAQQRQCAINSLHVKYTLDPETSSQDGTADKLLALLFQDNSRVREDRELSNSESPNPGLTNEAEKLRLEARKNKEHFAKLLLEETIPDGESMAFGDLTEFEVESDDGSEDIFLKKMPKSRMNLHQTKP